MIVCMFPVFLVSLCSNLWWIFMSSVFSLVFFFSLFFISPSSCFVQYFQPYFTLLFFFFFLVWLDIYLYFSIVLSVYCNFCSLFLYDFCFFPYCSSGPTKWLFSCFRLRHSLSWSFPSSSYAFPSSLLPHHWSDPSHHFCVPPRHSNVLFQRHLFYSSCAVTPSLLCFSSHHYCSSCHPSP